MAAEFLLPDVGEGLTEAEIIAWRVAVGDRVAVDQPLVEVETAKSVVELPSPVAGTVLHLGGADGDVLAVGAVVAVIGEPGERWPADNGGDAPIVGTLSAEAVELAAPVRPDAAASNGPRALPPVRRLARSLGVDLHTVTGTGPGGTITRDDVSAAAGPATPTSAAADQPPVPPQDVRRPLSMMRRTIVRNLTQAWSQIPLVTAFDEVDATRLLSARKALAARYDTAIPMDAMLVAATLPVLRAFPEFNSSLDGDTLVLHGRLDIGIAVDTPAGLTVAVITDAGSMNVWRLAAEVRRLGEGARNRTLKPADLSGQTFTVSNIGAVGGGGPGTPLVPLGTVAILSVGRATPKPVARGDRVEVAPVMPLSLSYDHRVIDGAAGRRFLTMLSEVLTEPVLINA